jgi:hypothetical protein
MNSRDNNLRKRRKLNKKRIPRKAIGLQKSFQISVKPQLSIREQFPIVGNLSLSLLEPIRRRNR